MELIPFSQNEIRDGSGNPSVTGINIVEENQKGNEECVRTGREGISDV
jgi:hypothetical protein